MPERRKKSIFDFNHVQVSKEDERTLREYYASVHRKYWMARACRKDSARKNIVCNVLAAVLTASGVGSAVGTASPVMLVLVAAGAALKAFSAKKGYNKKSELAKGAEVVLKTTLDDIQAYMRGGTRFDNVEFSQRLQEREKLLDGLCPDTTSFLKKYKKKFVLK